MSNDGIIVQQQDVPDFLRPTEDQERVGFEGLSRYARPSFCKVIQGQTGAPLKPPFEDGDLVLVPENELVVKLEEIIHLVVMFFYNEFTVQNPLGAKEFIRERTFDPTSEIATRARSRDPKEREFPCPEDPEKKCTYVEHLNFIVQFLDNEDLVGKLCVLSFFKGEWRYGSNFATLLDSRPIAHICGNRFQLQTGIHQGGGYRWYGCNVTNPQDGVRYITDEDQFNSYVKVHDKLRELYASEEIDVSYKVEGGDDEESSDEF